MIANPAYAQAFSYVPICLEGRNSFIVDDDDNEDNDCEQADMTQIVLNLAFVSDDFVN